MSRPRDYARLDEAKRQVPDVLNAPGDYPYEEWDDADDEECDRCHGDGMDPWNDYLLPCPACQGKTA